MIQRKVTNGYRAMWAEPVRGSGTRNVVEWQAEGAEAEADVRTTIDTARLIGANPFTVIVGTLA